MAGNPPEILPKIGTFACERCGLEYETQHATIMGVEIRCKVCPACAALQNAEATAKLSDQAARARDEGWASVCPKLYRDTDPARLPTKGLEIINAWPLATRGLGLTGETGKGKTRLCFLALRRAYDTGLTVAAVSHNRFSLLAQDAFAGEPKARAEARDRFTAFRSIKVLLLDDLGKAPRTERADAEFEELVEHRCANELPILFTANASGEWLATRFGEDRGPALVRRLGEFCDVHAL